MNKLYLNILCGDYIKCYSKKCLHFYLHQDYILIELTQSGLKGSAESSGKESQEEDVTLVVNPNYTFDD